MRSVFFLLILVCLSPIILNASSCTIDNTKGKSISNFDGCKSYLTSSDNKICCYVSGKDKDSNDISACHEFSGTEKGVAKDLFELEEGLLSKKYYLQVDCNLGKKISLCHPDDMKSDKALSTNVCKNNYYVSLTGLQDDIECCYLTGKSIQNKDVYSCVGIDKYFYTKEYRTNEIESGEYKRLGALRDVKINCHSSDSTSSSSSSFLSGFLSLLVALFSFLL